MSLDTVCKLCREFKILRHKRNLNINYNLSKCLKHSCNIVKVCLNYESNVDIVAERIVLECLVLKDFKLQNYKWFLEPDYIPRKVIGIKYINFESVVGFVLTQRIHLYVAVAWTILVVSLLWKIFQLRINFVNIISI